VVVPFFDPLTNTEIPSAGLPELALVTLPATLNCCATALLKIISRKQQKSDTFFISKRFVF
jgi:hypothetical protein